MRKTECKGFSPVTDISSYLELLFLFCTDGSLCGELAVDFSGRGGNAGGTGCGRETRVTISAEGGRQGAWRDISR